MVRKLLYTILIPITIILPKAALALEFCWSPPDAKMYLQRTLGNWKIIKSNCSCSAVTQGSPTTVFSVHANRAATNQLEPDFTLIVALGNKLKKPMNNIPIKIDGFDVESSSHGHDDVIMSKLDIDLLETLSASNVIEIGPHKFSLKGSAVALKALMKCYATLTGK